MTGLVLTNTKNLVLPQVNEEKVNFPWLKQSFYLIISVLLTVGVFFLEQESFIAKQGMDVVTVQPILTVEGNNRVELLRSGSQVPEKFTNKIDIKVGDVIKTNASSNVTLRFTGDALLRLDEDTVVSVSDLNADQHKFTVELENGQVWINNLYNNAQIAVRADGLLIEPQEALLNIYRVDKRIDLHVHRHQVKVSFFDEEGQYLNEFFVSEGNKVTVSLKKLNSILSKLYYSKLIKEFQYSIFDDALVATEPWVRENLSKDEKQDTEVRDRKRQEIKAKGLKNSKIDTMAFQFSQLLNHQVKPYLTFVPAKQKNFYVQDLFAHVDDAIYLSEEGRIDEANKRLQLFDLLKGESFYAQNITPTDFKAALEKRIRSLVFVVANEDLYGVKQYLLNHRLELSDADVAAYFEYLKYYLDDVYDAARLTGGKATLVLENYFKMSDAVLASLQGNLASYDKFLQMQNHFLDNLFLRYPVFYKKQFFQSKAKIEKNFLAELPEGQLKDEESQTLISKKIELLKRLQYFFFNDQLDLEDAKSVVGALITNIEDLLPPDSSRLAIQEFFKKSLGDFNLFWGFLNKDEYSAANTYGASNQERYDAYVKSVDENAVLLDLATTFFTKNQNNEVTVISRDEIIRQVKKDLTELGFKNISFGEDIKDGDQIVKIQSALFVGFNISALYERERALLSDIYVGGNLVSKSAVKLKNLELLIESKFSGLKDNAGSNENSTDVSPGKVNKKQKLLIKLFVDHLAAFNLNVTAEDIEVLDEELGSFHVLGLPVLDAAEALYSFDVINGSEVATNIYIITLKHQIKLKEDVPLKSLNESVKSAYNEYLLEVDKAPAKVPKKPMVKTAS